MPQKPVSTPVKPLEPWCAGSELPVGTVPRNEHVRCRLCGRIVPVVESRLQRHRNIPDENRSSISDAGVA
jgi:hypothetical protein